MSVLGTTDIGNGLLAIVVDHDPLTVSTDAPMGSLIIKEGEIEWYRKLDSGDTTNVALMGLTNTEAAGTDIDIIAGDDLLLKALDKLDIESADDMTLSSGEDLDLEAADEIRLKGEVVEAHCDINIGRAEKVHGLDVGAGGSHNFSQNDDCERAVYLYDASAVSGSKFTEVDIPDDYPITQLSADQDAFYFGVEYKHYAWFFDVTSAMSTTGSLKVEIWNGASWVALDKVVLVKNEDTQRENVPWEHIEEQYISIDKEVESSSWTADDAVLDEIPDFGMDLYWVRIVNVGAVASAAVFDVTKWRASDFDVNADNSSVLLWGEHRKRKRFSVAGAAFMRPEPSGLVNKDTTAFVTTLANPGYVSRRIHVYGVNYPTVGAESKGRGAYSGGWSWIDGGELEENPWTVFRYYNGTSAAWSIAAHTVTLTVDGSPTTIYVPAVKLENYDSAYFYVDRYGNTYWASGLYLPRLDAIARYSGDGYTAPADVNISATTTIKAHAFKFLDGAKQELGLMVPLPSDVDTGSRIGIVLGLMAADANDYEIEFDIKRVKSGDVLGPAVANDQSFSRILSFTPGQVTAVYYSDIYARKISIEMLPETGCVFLRIFRDATPGNVDDTGGDLHLVEMCLDYTVRNNGRHQYD